MKNILFRVDSSSNIGIGHVMRSLTLAGQLNNFIIFFASQNLNGNINFKIKEHGYKFVLLQSNDCYELEKIILENNIDIAVFDHYEIDYDFEKKIKERTLIKIFSFDDTYEKHFCDYLLNQNMYANPNRYINLVPTYCKIFCGQQYALLREEFHITKQKRKKEKNSNVLRILLTLGGADSNNVTEKILVALNMINIPFDATVVLGKANVHQKEIYEVAKNKKNVKVIVDANNMSELFYNSDFAIMAGGSSVLEALYLQIPFISIILSKNQELVIKSLVSNNLSISLGWYNSLSIQSIITSIEDFILHRKDIFLKKNLNMIDVASFDFNGIFSESIFLKVITKKDTDYLFKLVNEKSVRGNALNSKLITYNEHQKWFNEKLEDIKNNKSKIYLCEFNNNLIGQIRIDKKGMFWIVDIAIELKYRSQGFGHKILDSMLKTNRDKIFIAYINKKNISSIKIFEKTGFVKSKEYNEFNFYKYKNLHD